ncbi:MAG: acyltransferase [Lachnospiraceae bacterium]|nr:acyltransferase [Lachnospiraceae bacterium]
MNKRDSNTIKGVSILCMIFYHLFSDEEFISEYMLTGLIVSEEVTHIIASACHITVCLFVFISGYGFTKKMRNKNTKSDYKEGIQKYIRLVLDVSYILVFCMIISYLLGSNSNLTAEAAWGGGLINQLFGICSNAFGVAGMFGQDWYVSSWWYVGLAVKLIFLAPIVYRLVRTLGPYYGIAIGILMPSALGCNVKNDTFARYFPVFVIGICFAEYEMLEKIKIKLQKSKIYEVALIFLLLLLIPVIVVVKINIKASYLHETALTVVIVILINLTIHKIKFVNQMFSFLGDNSAYMWLIHVCIYKHWFPNEVFVLKNIWLIFVTVVASSLLLAVILKYYKKYIVKKCNILERKRIDAA